MISSKAETAEWKALEEESWHEEAETGERRSPHQEYTLTGQGPCDQPLTRPED